MILIADAAAVSTPGLTPSSKVTDFLCSDIDRCLELISAADDEVDTPRREQRRWTCEQRSDWVSIEN